MAEEHFWNADEYVSSVAEFVEPMRAKHKEKQFRKALQNAYELGKRPVKKAKKSKGR